MKVLLFCPVQVDSNTLALALASHRGLEGDIERLYIDDNINEMSSLLLAGERVTVVKADRPQTEQKDYRSGVCHQWNTTNVGRVAGFKNAAIKVFLNSDADYLFLVDSDVIVHPKTVVHLMSLDKPIVSEVFWSRWASPTDIWSPQVWNVHPYAHDSLESFIALREPGQFEVGGLGACTLIHRSVLDAGVNFTPIASLPYEGEDRHFCVRASAHGFSLTADTVYPPFHVVRPDQLDEASIWFEQGCDPRYFRECWLTDEWADGIRNHRAPAAAKSIAFCLPGQSFSSTYLIHLLDLMAWCPRHGLDTRVYNGYTSNPSVTRQSLTKLVLGTAGKAPDYVLWLDDDNVLTDDQLEKLIHGLDTHPELEMIAGWCDVAADCYAGPSPKASCGYFDDRGRCVSFTHDELVKADGLVGIEWSGFPAVLMRGSLLQKLGHEGFRYINDYINAPEHGFYGEDVSFCKRMIEGGYAAACDTRVKVPHLKLRDANTGVTSLVATLNLESKG